MQPAMDPTGRQARAAALSVLLSLQAVTALRYLTEATSKTSSGRAGLPLIKTALKTSKVTLTGAQEETVHRDPSAAEDGRQQIESKLPKLETENYHIEAKK